MEAIKERVKTNKLAVALVILGLITVFGLPKLLVVAAHDKWVKKEVVVVQETAKELAPETRKPASVGEEGSGSAHKPKKPRHHKLTAEVEVAPQSQPVYGAGGAAQMIVVVQHSMMDYIDKLIGMISALLGIYNFMKTKKSPEVV